MTAAPASIPTATPRPPVNIAARVLEVAARLPDKPAVITCTGTTRDDRTHSEAVTFGQLAEDIAAYARGCRRIGIGRGTRTILMVPPGCDFFALTFALFKLGAVPVLIDPGMGRRKLIECLAEIGAEAFIGIPRAHLARVLYRRAFRSVRIAVTAGRRMGWGGWRLEEIYDESSEPLPPADTSADEMAAILFTSGSTGPAKGAVYTHGIFDAQVRFLQSQYGFGPDEVDLATFPLFALFDAALGMTAVIPDMDPSRPAAADPRSIIAAVRDHAVTHMFASPALIDRVSRYAIQHGIVCPGIRRVLTAGAPVPPAVLGRARKFLGPAAQIFTPYGATEALPVASIESREILAETAPLTSRGAGLCVGRPLPGIDARIIAISDEPIATMAAARPADAGAIGEICVRGPVVTREYFRRPDATALAKIADGDTYWHRMGDLGRFDDQGRLWFCGRKSHRVQTARELYFTICCEGVFNAHPDVRRTALVSVGPSGMNTPVLCVELEGAPSHVARQRIELELRRLGKSHDHTRGIERFLFHPGFPVDVRHNAKIDREELAAWAARQLGSTPIGISVTQSRPRTSDDPRSRSRRFAP